MLEQLKADGSLPVDDRRVVKRVNKGQCFQIADTERLVAGLIVVCPVQDHVGAVAPRRLDLRQRRALRHDHGRAYTKKRGRAGDTLGVITR